MNSIPDILFILVRRFRGENEIVQSEVLIENESTQNFYWPIKILP